MAAAALAVPLAGAGIAAAPASAAVGTVLASSVAAYRGEVLISEFRLSGPRGAGDQYAELYNAGPPVSLAGFKLTASPGAHRCPPFPGLRCRRRHGTSVTIPATAPVLPTGGAYLITGRRYSLSGVAHRDLSVSQPRIGWPEGDRPGRDGDRRRRVCPGGGWFLLRTPLPALPGTPADQYAWVRVELRRGAGQHRQ